MHIIYEEKDYNTNIPLLGDSDTYNYTNSEYQGRKSSEVSVDFLILTYSVLFWEMKKYFESKIWWLANLKIILLFHEGPAWLLKWIGNEIEFFVMFIFSKNLGN